MIERKLFPSDKNYILKEVQHETMMELLKFTGDYSIGFYQNHHNPLGIIDDTMKRINDYTFSVNGLLIEFYNDLAGIYRYKCGENQLEILFSGTSHYEKYLEEWKSAYKEYIRSFCYHSNYLKAFLEATVFYSHSHKTQLAGNRLKVYINQEFQLKVYKYRGIQRFAS